MLSKDALLLLPDPESTPRCAQFTASLGVDPAGSAIAASIVLVVETPLPWPKPVFNHTWLGGLANTPALHCGASRILAAVPQSVARPGLVHAWWLKGPTVRSAQLQVENTAQLHSLVKELGSCAPDDSRFLIGNTLRKGADAAQAVLICAQGSHDVCCGTEGTRLAHQLTAAWAVSGTAESPTVFRVSHTGGHRFSPTAMTLPDGRMWAFVTADDISGIMERSVTSADVAPKCRGWWGAAKGPAQVAEREAFIRHGWRQNGETRTVTAIASVDADTGETFDVHRELADGTTTVDRVTVATKRQVPTIACRALGGLPAKPGIEYMTMNGDVMGDHS